MLNVADLNAYAMSYIVKCDLYARRRQCVKDGASFLL